MKTVVMVNKQVGEVASLKQYFLDKEVDVTYVEYSGDLKEYKKLAEKITSKEFDKGVIVTNNGVGAFLTATKVQSSIAAPVLDEYTAKWSVTHNNAQIAILPLSIISEDYAIKLVDIFLNTNFEGGRHAARVNMMDKLY